jgi:hypothetical protein
MWIPSVQVARELLQQLLEGRCGPLAGHLKTFVVDRLAEG